MTTRDVFRRLRIGVALLVGFALGKFLAQTAQHHASEFFIGGFGIGVVLTQWLFSITDSPSEREDGEP